LKDFGELRFSFLFPGVELDLVDIMQLKPLEELAGAGLPVDI